MENSQSSWEKLVSIMATLRGDPGCPWDKEQTHESLTPYLIEESYEVLETIEEKKYDRLCEELGDLLLQIVFHAQIAKEEGLFDIERVASGIVEKMIRRHPHVFGNVKVSSAKEVLKNWEEIKLAENEGKRTSLMDGIPNYLPALLQAERIQGRAVEAGFDWPAVEGTIEKVKEEADELLEAYHQKDIAKLREETGDLLFALVNFSRWAGINAEDALRATIKKFISRFKYIETMSAQHGKNLKGMSLEEMDKYWEEAKNKLPFSKLKGIPSGKFVLRHDTPQQDCGVFRSQNNNNGEVDS